MIKKLIKKIRHQPKAARDKIALVTAGVFTFAVFTVWAYHLPDRVTALTEQQTHDSSPGFSQMFSEIGDQISSFKESIPEEVDTELATDDQVSSSSAVVTDGASSTSTFVTSSTTLPMLNASTSSSSGTEEASSVPPNRAIRIVTSSSSAVTASSTTGAEVE